ncbi:unnamed protein product, partial [Didymodactylos carnosus]
CGDMFDNGSYLRRRKRFKGIFHYNKLKDENTFSNVKKNLSKTRQKITILKNAASNTSTSSPMICDEHTSLPCTTKNSSFLIDDLLADQSISLSSSSPSSVPIGSVQSTKQQTSPTSSIKQERFQQLLFPENIVRKLTFLDILTAHSHKHLNVYPIHLHQQQEHQTTGLSLNFLY